MDNINETVYIARLEYPDTCTVWMKKTFPYQESPPSDFYDEENDIYIGFTKIGHSFDLQKLYFYISYSMKPEEMSSDQKAIEFARFLNELIKVLQTHGFKIYKETGELNSSTSILDSAAKSLN